ncbi:MAG TPA: ABC transporter permease [Atribacteraceae bacterium]|nr:ABC transporter permease [Atribacteraceae bacterium]
MASVQKNGATIRAKNGTAQLYRLVRPNLGLFIALLLLIIIGVILSPAFYNPRNIFNVLRQVTALGVISVGMTFVIISGNGGVDLSAGATLSLASCLAAGLMNGQRELIVPVVLLVLGVGMGIGLANGLLITKFRTDPFITTLGMMTTILGLAFFYTRGAPFGLVAREFRVLSEGFVGPLPVPVILFVLVFAVCGFILRKTTFGRHLYAIGGNQEAARLSGIRVNAYKTTVYVIAGLTAAFAGLMQVSRTTVGDPRLGVGVELDAIAAVIIGGTSFAGGVGGASGTIAGVLIIAIIGNLMNLLDVSAFLQDMVQGLIILGAVIMQRKKTV